MKKHQNSINALFELVRAGLWEKEALLLSHYKIDYDLVLSLSQQHAVTGLVTAGIEHVKDKKIPQDTALSFADDVLQLEQRNRDMDIFITSMIKKMRQDNLYSLLVKGVSLSQCYTRPLWRDSCDIDLFFARDNFTKAVEYFKKLSSDNTQDSKFTKSYTVVLGEWLVELHGTLRSGLSTRLDLEIDSVQDEVFRNGDVRTLKINKIDIFLPGVDSDLFLLFTHFVRHFYHNEFIIRQTCDWCRFLWTYKDKINTDLLYERLQRTNLLNEWKSFAAFSVNYLGIDRDVMPFYDSSVKWREKAKMIMNFIMREKAPNRFRDSLIIFRIFPSNTLRFLPSLLFNVNGMKIRERLFTQKRLFI